MTKDKPYRLWPEANERVVVEEMIRDQGSKYWEQCNKFVKRYVYTKAKNIPTDHRDEIVQEVMHKVARSLHTFQFQSAFQTWLVAIIRRSIIDVYRKIQKEKSFAVSLETPSDDDERENQQVFGSTESAEKTFLAAEDLRSVKEAMLKYADTHANSIRNRQIILIFIEGEHTHAEIAKVVGCKPPVVGYVIRQAYRYAREEMGE